MVGKYTFRLTVTDYNDNSHFVDKVVMVADNNSEKFLKSLIPNNHTTLTPAVENVVNEVVANISSRSFTSLNFFNSLNGANAKQIK